MLLKHLQIATKLQLRADVFSRLHYYSEGFGFPAVGNLSVQVTKIGSLQTDDSLSF